MSGVLDGVAAILLAQSNHSAYVLVQHLEAARVECEYSELAVGVKEGERNEEKTTE
jgi:hypothetical protein